MRVREGTSWLSFLNEQPWKKVGVKALVGRNHTNSIRSLEKRLPCDDDEMVE